MNWKTTIGLERWQQRILKNSKKIITYRLAHNGFLFGKYKGKTRLEKTNQSRCVVCDSVDYTTKRMLTECPMAVLIKRELEEINKTDY